MIEEPSIAENVSYYLSVVATTAVLIWGLKHVSRELGKVNEKSGRTFLAEALSEKHVRSGAVKESEDPEVPSFSRVAGALGAVGLAATYVGIGYWALFELYFGDDLGKLSELSTFFLAGSALFIPYAFKALASVFK